MKAYLWTGLKARLQFIHSAPGKAYNWIFLPGGPGLGSESLSDLTALLTLPGTIWHLDLPGDGSNTTVNNKASFSHWSEALVEAVRSLENVILVGHSTGGMYALATAELSTLLKGLVLISSAPDNSWREAFTDYVEKNPLPESNLYINAYIEKPSNETLKALTIASAPYSFLNKNLNKGKALLQTLPYNYETCSWSDAYFDPTYTAKWIPTIPTLICTGDMDNIIPLEFFRKAAAFQKSNIIIRDIKGAAHFPWLDNPKALVALFNEYLAILD